MTYANPALSRKSHTARHRRIAIEDLIADLIQPGADDHARSAAEATPGACAINTVEPA